MYRLWILSNKLDLNQETCFTVKLIFRFKFNFLFFSNFVRCFDVKNVPGWQGCQLPLFSDLDLSIGSTPSFQGKGKMYFFHRCILQSTKCLTNLPLEQFHFKGLLWQQNRALGLSKGVNWWLLQTKYIVRFYILANVFIFMLLIKFNSL